MVGGLKELARHVVMKRVDPLAGTTLVFSFHGQTTKRFIQVAFTMELVTLALLCVLAAIFLYILQRKPKNYPPGPRNWPIAGTLPAMIPQAGDTPFDEMEKHRKKYGNIVGLFMGTQPAILISGIEDVKEVLAKDEFNYRPDISFPQHKMFDYDQHGVFFTEGNLWKNQRRFTLRHLRDFGFGKQKMDEYIHEEAFILFDAINRIVQKQSDHPEIGLDLLTIMPAIAINTLWYIIAGTKNDLQDEKFIHLTTLVLKFFRLGNQASPVAVFKLLQKIPIINSNFREQEDCADELNSFVQTALNEHMQTYDENHARDFMDVYIKEMKYDKTGFFTVNQLTAICVDLFLAGTETTASTVGFTLRYLIKYPEIQEKVRQEIHRVVGKERLPSMDDMPNLPYCLAVLYESMRHSGIVPAAPPRSVAKDVTYKGYLIPKRSMILINLRSVHMDPTHWGDPENFRPERFINPEGKYQKDDHLMLFGSGMRKCLGESFARNSSFIFYTSLVQKYDMQIPSHGPKPSDVVLPGFTFAPESFNISFSKL